MAAKCCLKPSSEPQLSIELHQIVTFAAEAFGGNPAMVLVCKAAIPPPMLQRIAQHLREPVIAVLAPTGESWRLSFSTATGPHPGAGHVAHAAAHVALNRLGHDELALELDDGRYMRIRRNADGPSVEWPIMPHTEIDAIDAVSACIGVRPTATYAAPFGLFAVLASSEEVANVRPDLDAISALGNNTLSVTAPDQIEDFAIRVFAPKLGLPEDPVCGTAHRVVVPLWAERLGKTRLVSRQLSPRGGRLTCRLGAGTVTLGGAATPFFSGTIIADLQ